VLLPRKETIMKYSEMKDKAKKAGAIKNLSPTYYEFEKKGASIIGRYKGRGEVSSSLGKGTYFQYIFETDDGPIKCALGAATDKEAGQLLEPGKVYVISFLGKTKISGGRSVNKFTIEAIDEAAFEGEEEGEVAPY
jgi:hypothetical protein